MKLSKLDDATLAAKLVEAAEDAPAAMGELLRESADRLRANAGPRYRVTSMRRISAHDPLMYEGTLEDGDNFFIRFRANALTLHIDDHLVDFHEVPDKSGEMSLSRIQSLLRNTLDFDLLTTPSL